MSLCLNTGVNASKAMRTTNTDPESKTNTSVYLRVKAFMAHISYIEQIFENMQILFKRREMARQC